MTELKPG